MEAVYGNFHRDVECILVFQMAWLPLLDVHAPVIPQRIKSQETKIDVKKISPCQRHGYLLRKIGFFPISL